MPHYQYNNEYYDIPSEKAQEFEADLPDATVDVSDGNGNLYSLPVAKLREFKRDFPDWSYSPISPDVANSWQFKLGAKMAENLQNDSRTDATLASPISSSAAKQIGEVSPRDGGVKQSSQQFSTLDQAPEDTQQWLDEQKKQRQNKLNSQSITDSNVIGEQKKQLQQKYNDILDAQPAPHPFNTQPFGSNLPKDATYYSQAIAMLDDAQHTLDTAHKIPNSNPLQNFGRGAARGLFNMNTLTLGLDELFSNTTLLGILDKADSKGIEALSDAEEALINAAIVKQVVDNSTDLGRSYLVGRGFTENLPYMIEFALSGIPAGALTKGAGKKITNVMAQLARKASEKTTSRFMRGAAQQGAKFATGLSKGSVRAAAQLPLQSSTYNTLAERKIGQLDYADDAQGNLTYVARNNEDTPEALAKTVASAFTTNLVETFGGNVISDLASLPIRSLANSKAWQSLSRSLRQNKVIQFAQAAGYQGAPAEFFEEMIDSSLNAIITGDQSIADVYAPDNIINTAGVTLLTSLFMGSAAGITTSRTRSRVNREYTQASNDIVSAGYTPTQIEQLTDIALGTPTQVSNWLAGINNEINTLIQQSSTDGSLDDNQSSTDESLDNSAQRAQRIRQLISQRDFVLASAQYQALIGGMRDNIQPAIDAATQAINAQAHEQSGYTIKVFINNKALNGYLHSGNLDVTTLPDGTPQVNLNAHIYQVAVPRDNGEIDIIQATPQDIVIQQAVPTETVLRQGLDAINQPLNDLIAQDLQQAVEQQQTPQTVGEGVNQDDTSSPSPDAVPNDPNKPTDTSSLSDTDFDAHIDSLTPAEAISAIANRRGADEADQYATWKKAALTKQRDAAQKKLTRERKPFDASRYPSFNEMKAAERQYNTQIEQEKQDLNAQIATLNAQLADIEAYLIDRNKQIAAEREADNPLQGGIAQAVRKQPINTLEQYIAREIALGARLRLSDNTGNGLAAELGITPGSQEHRELLSILSNTEGFTPEQWAEYIIENIEPEYAHLINGRDTQDIRNAIIDTIHAGVTSRRRAYQFIADINQQQADAERQYYENTRRIDDTLNYPSAAQQIGGVVEDRRGLDDTLSTLSPLSPDDYEQQLLASLSPDDIAELDAMSGDYWDEIQDILQYEQEAYNNYDTNSTRPTPQDNLTQRENTTIQPSQETSNTTPIREHGPAHAEERPQSTAPAYPRSTRTDVVDNQGNPIDADGNLIVETVASIDEITDEDFETPTRSIALPTLPDNVSNAIGTNGRQIIIKKNVFEKNGSTHVELEPSDSREILQSALYNTNIVGTTQPIKRPDYKVAIRTGEKNAVVVLDVFQGKEYVEIIGWRKVNEKGLEKMQRQAEREGGQFLILSPSNGVAAALSALPSGTSSAHKDSERRENNKISSLNFSSEPNPILSKDTTSSPISNNFNEKIAQASADVNTNPTEEYTITPSQYTTKKGKVLDMHLVKFAGTLTKEQQRAAKELAKADKGWYDREQGGFMMRSEESAKQLADIILNNDDAVSNAQPVSMTEIQSLNDGDTVFTEPQQPTTQNGPIWQYTVTVDTDGYTVLTRDDVSTGIPIGDAFFFPAADSPQEMLDILRNPLNGMQEVLDAVGVTLENKIKTRELDRKIKEERRREYEALRANGYNGYKIGDEVIYKGKKAKIHDLEEYGEHRPVLDTGLAPVMYEVAQWSDIQKPQQNQSASSQTGQDLTTGYSIDNDAENSAKIHISKQGAKYELNKLVHKYVGQRKTRGFISDLAKALGNRDNTPRQTYYFDFNDKSGNPYTLRISNHNVNGENIADNEKEISIVIKSRRQPNNFNSGNADVKEYVYFKESIANGDGQTLAWIAQDIATMLDTGEYAENSGIAVVNISSQVGNQDVALQPLSPSSPSTPSNQGQFNLVSDERMDELRERLRRKLRGQMNIGIDPEILSIGLEIAVGHIDRGIKSFTDFARVMIDDLGDTIRPYLKAFYNGARDLPEIIDNGLANDMTPYNDVQQFDVANFLRPGIDPIATAQTVARETEVAQQAETAKQRIKNTNKKKKSLPSQGNQLNLFDNDTRTKQDSSTDNRGTQPRPGEIPQTQSVESRTPLQHPVEISRSERRNARISSSQSGDRPLYDVSKNYTNDEIAQIVSSVTAIVDGKVVITGDVTDDIKAICRQYKSGGVAKKGRGILDEYYTDGKIVDAVNLIIAPYFKGSQPVRVLEPSVGIGNFIGAVDNIPTSQVVAFEINDTTARIAKILHPQVDINLRSFETEFIDESGRKKPLPQKYNLIIGNPPYGSHRGLYKGLGEESKIARYEDYFVKRSLDVLQEGGILAMVLPSSWLDRHTRFGGYTIEAAYRLPSGAFEATEVGTDIVVLRKDSSVSVTQHTPYFEQHPDRILGDIKQRKGRYGRMEQYVEGNIDTAIEAIKREQAEHLAAQLNIVPTNDNINNIQAAIDETGSTEKATPIIETEKSQTPANKPSNPSSKYKITLNRGGETVPTSQQFSHPFSEGEVDAFADTDYDGTISNPTKHRKYANFIGGRFVHDFYYAEGNIYDKLAQLEQEKDKIIKEYGKEQYEKQKRLLESVLPKRKGLNEITISPNTTFVKNLQILTDDGRIPLKDMFIEFCRKLPYQAFGSSSAWEVIGYVNNEQVYGQDKQRNQLIRDRRKKAANDLFIKFLNEELSDDAKRQVVAAFNREYNSTYRPDYSRVPMFSTINKDFKGKPLKLTSVQLAGIGRMTVKGVGLLAHEVGFGKTLSGILAMHEAMTRGFATKPLIVVPNDNILKQWVETIKEVLPQATVNSLGNLGTNYDLTDFKINDGEFTIVTYEGLKAMSFSDDTYNRLAERFSYITEDLSKHKSERDIQKDIEKKKELKGKMRRGTKPSYMFEDFGFDWLTVDEVHNANHIVSKVRLDKSIASDFRSQGQRTSDLGLKTWLAAQYIQEENNGRNVLLLSATPFTNKPLEYYSILSLIANDMLRRKGFFNVDQFFETFMEADNELEIAANGKPVQKTNIRRFRNNGLFQQLLSEFIDIKGEEDNPDLVRPTRHNKEYKIAQNELTEQAIAASQDLLNDNDTVLQGIGHARAAAFSPYATALLGERPRNYREFVNNSPKIDATIKMIEQNKKDRPDAGQIIYSEVGVEFFPMIRDYLVNVSGFKPSEVRIITGATSNNERINIQSAFNKGEVKVVIGSPAIKEGLNLQENTTDMYILSLPWNFTQLRQIEGRGWRQGNKWENIRINYMLTNDSVDVFMLQRLQLKQGLYNEAMKSGAESLDVSDIDTSELKTALITDPDTRADIVTKQERNKLENEKTQIEADLSFVLRKFESYNKLLKKFEEKKNEIKLFKEWAAGGNTYWVERISSEENKLALIERDIQEEKINLQKKGVNVDEITRQTEQAQKAIEQINEKIENLKDFKESLADKYRKEREVKEKLQGDVIANYISERKAENNSGFYNIRPKQTLTDSKDSNQSSSDIPERIRDKFSFRELDDTTNSSSNSNWSPEEQSIIDQARDNGTYLLAPNGRPTNLTPRQWVQVRTKAFKQWFGDWQKAARIEKLRNSTPINIVFDNQYDLNRDSAKQWMKDNIRGEYTNKDTGETIQISRVGINEVTSHGTKDDAHLISITAIPQLIENAIFVDEQPNEKANDKYDSYRYYVCGAKINGEDYTIKVVIGVKGDSKYYDHRLTQIEKGILIDNLNGLSNSVAENQNASYSMGKDSKLLSILQTNASKIVDENGEPKVVRHNTNNEFSIFNDKYRGSNTGDPGVYGAGHYFGNIGQTDIYGYHEMDVFLDMRNPKIFPDDNIMTFFDYILENFDEPALQDIIINDAFNENRKTTLGKLISSIKEIKEADSRGEYDDLISQMQLYWGKGAHDLVLERKIFDKAGAGILRQLTNFVVDNITPEKFTEGLKKAGYDGVIKDWYEYVAFTPNQIKSATDNIGTFDNRFNDIRFRTSSPLDVAQQVVAQDMPRRIAKRAKQLADRLGVDITIINSNDELRQINDDYAYLADWLDGHIDGSTHRMAGMFANNDKRIFVFSNVIRNLQDPLAEVEKTITHEVVAHYGLRRLLGEEGLANFLSDVWQSLPTDKQIRWGKYAMNIKRTQTLSPTELATLYSDKQLQQKAAEEYIANISEQGVTTPTLWQRICAAFRRIMRRLGFYNYTPTEADIRYILAQSYSNLRRDAETTRVDSTLTSQSTSTNSQEDDELINAAIERFRENFNATEIVKVDNIAHLRRIYGDITDNEFYNLFKEYKKVGAMYDADLNKIFIFAENTRNPYTELIHEATHAAIQKLYNSENLADKLDTFIKEIEKLQPEGCNMIAEIYSGDDYINEIVAYALCGYIHNSSIEKLKEQLSPEAQQELLPILNEIGYEPGRKQHTKEYTRIFDTSRAGRNNSILPRTPRANQGNSSGVISQDARIPSQTRKQQTIADNTLSTLDDIGTSYSQYIANEWQAAIDAAQPRPTDDATTIASKILFREAIENGESKHRDNLEKEQFLQIANKISEAKRYNDKAHKLTRMNEIRFDALQRLRNLLDDINIQRKENGKKPIKNDPHTSQNQAKSRAQAAIKVFDSVYLEPYIQAISDCIADVNKDLDKKNKSQVNKSFHYLSLYTYARTAIERQQVKQTIDSQEQQELIEQAKSNRDNLIASLRKELDSRIKESKNNVDKAVWSERINQQIKSAEQSAEAAIEEAQTNIENISKHDYAGLTGLQFELFSINGAIDDDVKAAKGNLDKLKELAAERDIPTIEEFVAKIEERIGNPEVEGTKAHRLWQSIQAISEYQLSTSYNAGITSRAGYQVLTYNTNIDNLLKQRYEEQRKAIIDNPGNYDNVTDYDKEGNATGTRKQINSKAQQELYNLANEYAEAVKQVPMPNTQTDFQNLIETGWLTAEEVASFHRYYRYYMPLKGHAELTAEDVETYSYHSPRNQSEIKAVEGHEHLSRNNINQIILDTHGVIYAAEANRWKAQLYNVLVNNPNHQQYVVEQLYYKYVTDPITGVKTPELYGNIHKIDGKEIFEPGVPTAEEIATGEAFTVAHGGTRAKVDIPIRASQREEHIVTALVNGEPYTIFFYDKRIADAIKGRNLGLFQETSGFWADVQQYWRSLQGINRLYAGLKTSYNATFTLVTNLLRDWSEMTTNNLIANGVWHSMLSFVNRFRSAWFGDIQQALKKYQKGKLLTMNDAKTETERYVVEFILNGGPVNITQLPDYDKAKVEIAKEVEHYISKGKMREGNVIIRTLNNAAERVELASRLATYFASRKIGRSIEQSINDAKEATVNFDRKGTAAGILGLMQMFYNAGEQAVRRQLYLLKHHPVRFLTTYAIIGIVKDPLCLLSSYLFSSMFTALFGDDDDEQPTFEDICRRYYAITPELRRTYNVIMLGDTYIRIPMPINYLPYTTLGSVINERMFNPIRRPNWIKDTLDIISATLDAFTPSMFSQPIGFTFDAITSTNNNKKQYAINSAVGSVASSALGTITTPIIEPFAQSLLNYSFMGSSLYDKPYNGNSQEPAYLRARTYTPQLWVDVSRVLNEVTGGNEVKAGGVNIAPEQIDNVMGILGVIEEYGSDFATLIPETYKLIMGDADTDKLLKSIPLISRLYGGNANERYDKAMQSLFYDDMSALAKFNEYRKNADTPELMEDFNREYTPDEQRYFADLNTMQRIHNVLKREERAKQNAAASPSAAQQIEGVVEDRGGSDIQALYELANTQFQSLASGDYQPVNDPYYKYMYLLDAIRNTPYTTQAGEVVNIGSLNKSERKQLLKNDKEMLDMLNLLDDVKEDFADIDKKYYPGKQLDDKQQRLYDQRLPRIVKRISRLNKQYIQLTNNKK